MWRGEVPTQRNPIELVTVKGASKRTRQPRSLTVSEFQQFAAQLSLPFRHIALICVCFGLRISEALALKWSDVDWLNGRLRVERGIVRQIVDEVKTVNSERTLHVDAEMLNALKAWRQETSFPSRGLGICFAGEAGTSAIFLHRHPACVSESGGKSGHWYAWHAQHETHLQVMA